MPISHATNPELYDPLWFSLIVQGIEEAKKRDFIPLLYAEARSTRESEKVTALSGVGATPLFTGVLSMAQPVKLHEKKTDFPEYAQGVAITQKMMEDNQYQEAVDFLRMLGDGYFKRKQIDGIANMFNNAFNPAAPEQYLAPDGLPLVHTAHTWFPGGPTISNRITATFSKASLEAALQLFRTIPDAQGFPRYMQPDILVVPTNLLIMAQEILGSTQGPYTANLGQNILGGDANRLMLLETPMRIKILWSPLLTDQTAAFLVSTEATKRQKSLLWFQRIPPETFKVQGHNAFTFTYGLRARHGLLMRDPFWVVGIKP